MIEFKNIQKKFGEKEVLKGVSGIFAQGKVNQIIGASGTTKAANNPRDTGAADAANVPK